jgi:hypothetical protein
MSLPKAALERNSTEVKVQEQVLVVLDFDQLEQFLSQLLDVHLVQDFPIDESDHAHITDFGKLQSPMNGH